MSQKTLAGDRRRRKLMTALWTLLLTAVIVTLIYLEQSAILYILSTVGITVLLLIVAFSDLAHADGKSEVVPAPNAPGVAGRER